MKVQRQHNNTNTSHPFCGSALFFLFCHGRVMMFLGFIALHDINLVSRFLEIPRSPSFDIDIATLLWGWLLLLSQKMNSEIFDK